MNLRVLYILLTILIFNQFSFGQKIEPGKYVSVSEYNPITNDLKYYDYGESITILDSNRFEYKYWDDITETRGYGKYNTFDNSLRFEFLNYLEIVDTSHHTITDSTFNQSDTITIKLKIYSYNRELKDAFIAYWKGSDHLIKMSSDKYGVANIRISKKDLGGLLQISYIGVETVKFYLLNEYDKNITIKLDKTFSIIPKDKVLIFSINEIDDYGFYAKSTIFTNWTLFKRKN